MTVVPSHLSIAHGGMGLMCLSPVYPHCEHWLAAVDMVRPLGEDWGDHAALDASPPLSRTNPNLKPAVGLPPVPHGPAIPCNCIGDGSGPRIYLLDPPACAEQGSPWSSLGTFVVGRARLRGQAPHVAGGEASSPSPSRPQPRQKAHGEAFGMAQLCGGLSPQQATSEAFLHSTWAWG